MSDTTILNIDEREAQVLEAIHAHDEEADRPEPTTDNKRRPPVPPTQRDIAHAVGLSLGMTNAILKRLATKGFVTMQRINGRNIHYLVTPTGIELIARRSYRYLRRTVGHIVRYKEKLHTWLEEQVRAGVTTVILVGESDLDFLVEWCAEALELTFHRTEETHKLAGGGTTGAAGQLTGAPNTTVVLMSEKLASPSSAATGNNGAVSLTDLLIAGS